MAAVPAASRSAVRPLKTALAMRFHLVEIEPSFDAAALHACGTSRGEDVNTACAEAQQRTSSTTRPGPGRVAPPPHAPASSSTELSASALPPRSLARVAQGMSVRPRADEGCNSCADRFREPQGQIAGLQSGPRRACGCVCRRLKFQRYLFHSLLQFVPLIGQFQCAFVSGRVSPHSVAVASQLRVLGMGLHDLEVSPQAEIRGAAPRITDPAGTSSNKISAKFSCVPSGMAS